jgi:GMP synthase-like glutamine amidotransferase
MKIGILLTGHTLPELVERRGDQDRFFAQLLAGFGFDFTTYAVVDGALPDSPQDQEGWLITGSKHGAYDDLPWIAPLEAFIREIRAANLPLVGICFGHQIIAQALGGRVIKYPGGWQVGRTEYDIDGETFHLNAWHQDQVTELPEGAEVIASTPHCAYAGLRIGERILTIQPHPEFDAEIVETLIAKRGPGVVPDPLLTQAAERLPLPTDAPRFADRIAQVLRKGA